MEAVLLKRDEILSVAAKLFAVKGYHNTSMDDIAGDVGLLRGSLYHHYESKEKILLMVMLKGLEAYKESISIIESSTLPFKYRLERAVLAHIKPFDWQMAEVTVFLNEKDKLSKELVKTINARVKEYEGIWENLMCEGVKYGYISPEFDYKITLNAIFGMCNWLHRWYDSQGKYSIEEIAQQFSRLILNGICEQNNGEQERRI